MSDFVAEEENVRNIEINLEELPESLIYKIPEIEWTFSPERFGVGEYLHIEYYEARFEKAYPGLLQQFPMLYYMVEEWHAKATKRTPLEEILMKKELNQ
jgi:hypothetical protein